MYYKMEIYKRHTEDADPNKSSFRSEFKYFAM